MVFEKTLIFRVIFWSLIVNNFLKKQKSKKMARQFIEDTILKVYPKFQTILLKIVQVITATLKKNDVTRKTRLKLEYKFH